MDELFFDDIFSRLATAACVCDDEPRVTAIQCNGTDLPNFVNAQRLTSYPEVMPFAHDVIYSCVHEGHRFEDGDTSLSVTCSLIGWTWNPVVTSCQRTLFRCY